MSGNLVPVEQPALEHSPEACAAGYCPHAISPKLPCRCPDCNAETAAIVAGYRAERAAKLTESELEAAPRFAQRTFAAFIQSDANYSAFAAAQEVAQAPNRGIGLSGPPGVGKSHLAAAICNACRERGILARFVAVDDLLARCRETIGDRKSGSEYLLVASFAAVPVLAIDDFGKEALTDYAVRTLFALVNKRYELALPLIVTSNFDFASLCKRPVARDAEPVTYRSTMDRLAEMSGAWYAIGGRSHR